MGPILRVEFKLLFFKTWVLAPLQAIYKEEGTLIKVDLSPPHSEYTS